MKRSRSMPAVLIAIVFSLALAAPAMAADQLGNGLMTVDGMPVVVLSGTPEERGTAYGKAVGPMIKENLDSFWGEAKAKGKDRAGMAARALELAPSFPEHMVTEIRAMAAASGLDFGELLAMNMFGSSVRGHDGCTIIVALGSGSESGKTMASKTRDANRPNVILVVEALEGKHGFVAVAGAGDWGISFGLNDAGLCDGNNWMPVPEFFEGGWDENPLNRYVLEMCSTVDEAIELVSTVEKYGGTTVMVADNEKAAFIEAVSSCYETEEGTDTVWEVIEDGVAVHTNHYTLEPFFNWVVNDGFGYFWVPSVSRMDRAYELLSESGDTVSAQDLISFTRDVDDNGNSQPWEVIERHLDEMPWGTWGFGWPGFSICNIRTVSAGVLEIDPEHPSLLSVMWSSVNNPAYTPYFPLHNGVLLDVEGTMDALSDYVSGAVSKSANLLRSGCFNTWGDLVPLLTEWEATAFERTEEAEVEALVHVLAGDLEEAASVLLASDASLGQEAYDLVLSLQP